MFQRFYESDEELERKMKQNARFTFVYQGSNQKNSIKVKYKDKVYESINSFSRHIDMSAGTVKKYIQDGREIKGFKAEFVKND